MFKKILVVCVGNICRSPLGEALLRQRFPERLISSAGVAAVVESGAHEIALELAAEKGLDLNDHRARQVTSALVNDADLVLVMTQGQRGTISELYPAATGKTMLFGQWLNNEDGNSAGRDIPDPNGKSREAFEQVFRQLERAADAWQAKL